MEEGKRANGEVPGAARRPLVSPARSLAVLHPAIAAEWHPTKNGDLTPADVVPRSAERVFWQCATDPRHVWESQVHSRLRAKRCPFCAGQRATPETSLRARRPDVAARWHATRNGERTPGDVTPGSGHTAWWQCAADPSHEWEAKVADVTGGRGCPFCSGRRATPKTSLQGCFPEVAAEWHPTDNGALTPDQVTWSCSRRVAWRCRSCEHVWYATVSARAAYDSACPACSGRVATPKTSLLALHPEIAREWHPTANGALTPDDVRPNAARKVWWRCAEDPSHDWQTTVASRGGAGSGCPFCSRTRVTPETSLAALHPRLSREWHPEKNAPLTPRDVLPGTPRKAWWRCGKDRSHEWESSVVSRSSLGAGCPMCAGKVATRKTSLAARHPRIAREWHPTMNGALTPQDVVSGSGRKVWWRCRKDPSHTWAAQIVNRTSSRPTGCPICHGRVATPETSLRGRFPELAAQWHPTKNQPLTPDDIVPGANRKVWWRCPVHETHVWATIVANRTRRGDGCPYCSGRRRAPEQEGDPVRATPAFSPRRERAPGGARGGSRGA